MHILSSQKKPELAWLSPSNCQQLGGGGGATQREGQRLMAKVREVKKRGAWRCSGAGT